MMGKLILLVLMLLLTWDAAWWVMGVPPRFPWQLRSARQAAPARLVLLDVRTAVEYRWFHLHGAVNLPWPWPNDGKLPPVDPDQEVVVICLTGHWSPLVAYALKKRGCTQVSHLTGGMVGWKIYAWLARQPLEGEPPAGRGSGQ